MTPRRPPVLSLGIKTLSQHSQLILECGSQQARPLKRVNLLQGIEPDLLDLSGVRGEIPSEGQQEAAGRLRFKGVAVDDGVQKPGIRRVNLDPQLFPGLSPEGVWDPLPRSDVSTDGRVPQSGEDIFGFCSFLQEQQPPRWIKEVQMNDQVNKLRVPVARVPIGLPCWIPFSVHELEQFHTQSFRYTMY
jgi:hypothetical protein